MIVADAGFVDPLVAWPRIVLRGLGFVAGNANPELRF
jgi:hypothetical protein